MQTLILRKSPVDCPLTRSKILYLCRAGETAEQAVRRLGPQKMTEQVFGESGSYSDLLRRYEAFRDGAPDEGFCRMYLVHPSFGAMLDAHITLYRFEPDTYALYRAAIPWVYAGNGCYMGDTWWFEEKEILQDLQTLPVPEFFEKYKGM